MIFLCMGAIIHGALEDRDKELDRLRHALHCAEAERSAQTITVQDHEARLKRLEERWRSFEEDVKAIRRLRADPEMESREVAQAAIEQFLKRKS